MPFLDFTAGQVLTADQVDLFLMRQAVMVFDDSASRGSALDSIVTEGMVTYRKDIQRQEQWNGTAWVPVGVDSFTTTGTAGYLLTSNGTAGVEWIDNGDTGQVILSAGTAGVSAMAYGDKGQVLTSAGTAGVQFTDSINPFLLMGA